MRDASRLFSVAEFLVAFSALVVVVIAVPPDGSRAAEPATYLTRRMIYGVYVDVSRTCPDRLNHRAWCDKNARGHVKCYACSSAEPILNSARNLTCSFLTRSHGIVLVNLSLSRRRPVQRSVPLPLAARRSERRFLPRANLQIPMRLRHPTKATPEQSCQTINVSMLGAYFSAEVAPKVATLCKY